MNERPQDASRKREQRAANKDVLVPACDDRERRERLEANDEEWLLYYFGPDSGVSDPFWYKFVPQQQEMIAAIRHAIQFGGDQSIAASRGEGKTTLCERLLLKYTLQGVISFSVLFAATGSAAADSLDSIKSAIEENELLLLDYPEVCAPVRALENTPNRAHYQTVSGARHDNGETYEKQASKFTWCGQEIVFPKVPGSPSSRAIIATRGLDAAVRGLKKKGRRPQVTVIDDPDTEETARSPDQAKKLEDRIDKGIGGLGGQQRPVSRVFLSTLQSRVSCSYKFTDPKQKPSFKGKRFRFLKSPPERTDLWDDYTLMWASDLQGGDEHCRRAHKFYLDNREAMDAGAEVSNPNRYNPETLADGTQVEVSALQHYFNLVGKLGADAVATEYDNDPPEEMGPVDSGISATRVQRRLSGYPQGESPPGMATIVQGIDIQKAGLHWVVKAFRADASFWVLDYGFHETHGTVYGVDEGVELAIRRALLNHMDSLKQKPYGPNLELTLVDSGYKPEAVYAACAQIGKGIYPAKGHGKTQGCAVITFTPHVNKDSNTKPGDGWYMKRQPAESHRVWLTHCDTDRWKAFEHERWMTDPDKPGAAHIFGTLTDEERRNAGKRMPRDSKDHHGFARHITAEVEVEDIKAGVLKRFWKVKPGRQQNHYLDASYLANVAASMKGVRLLGGGHAKPKERRSLAEMAAQK